jgi:hypothetical protein
MGETNFFDRRAHHWRIALLCLPLILSFQNCQMSNFSVNNDSKSSEKALAAAPVSAVMDFYDETLSPFPEGYLSPERLKERVLAYKELGVTRIYYRTDAGGPPSYRSALRPYLLGTHAAYSNQLKATLDHYDPLDELVRLAHAEGIQVFAWFRLYDFTCSSCFYLDPNNINQYGLFPLADPYYLQNPSLQWKSKAAAQAEKEGKTFGITKVVLQTTNATPRMVPEDIRIGSYRDASQYDTTSSGDVAAPEWATISQREVTAVAGGLEYEFTFSSPLKHGFIVIDHPYTDNGGAASFLNTPDKMIRLYSGSEEITPSHICLSTKYVGITQNFNCTAPSSWSGLNTALDYGEDGKPRRLFAYTHQDYALGMPSYTYPESKKHELDIINEVVQKYDIDGVALDLNTHTYIINPEDSADFSDPIVENYETTYGTSAFEDSAGTRFRLSVIRFQFFKQFLEDIRRLVGKKSLQLVVPPKNQDVLVPALQVAPKVSYYSEMGFTEGNDANMKSLIDQGIIDRFIIWGPDDISTEKDSGGHEIEPTWSSSWEDELEADFSVVGDSSNPRHLLLFNMSNETSATSFYAFIQNALAEPRLEGIILYETKELANNREAPPGTLLPFALTAQGVRLKQIMQSQ